MTKVLISVILFIIPLVMGLPLPTTYPGYAKGDISAPIFFEFFGDFQCPYTKTAYVTLEKVLDHYGPSKIRFNFHAYPLWIHRQAWDAAKAVATIVQENKSTNTTWDIISYFLDHQIEFFNFQFVDKTENDLFNLFAAYAKDLTGLDKATFMKVIASDSIYIDVDHGMHLGVTRGILGTPTFYINGFIVNGVDSLSSYDDWLKIIDPLIQ